MRSTLTSGALVLVLAVLSTGCGSSDGGAGSDDGGSGGQAGGAQSAGTASGGKQSSGGGSSSGGKSSGGAAMGGSATGGSGPGSMDLSAADKMALLEQAPHCTENFDYELTGNIDGGMVHDDRSQGFTGGYVNGSNGHFETPSEGTPRVPTRVQVGFSWTKGLANGDASTVVDGFVVAPDGNPRAGVELCVTDGVAGYVQGGADDGNFKFWLRAARVGADCAGEAVPIDLHGCM